LGSPEESIALLEGLPALDSSGNSADSAINLAMLPSHAAHPQLQQIQANTSFLRRDILSSYLRERERSTNSL
jgi:hypothetical protein